jgi:hypothetical protein
VLDDQLNKIVSDHHQAGLSRPDTVLLDFALKLTRSGPWLSGEDIAALRDQGFTDESILETILVTGLTDSFVPCLQGWAQRPISRRGRFPTLRMRRCRTDAPQVRTWVDNPEDMYSEAERRRLVEHGIMMLPAMYRVVLVLRDIEQLSTAEAVVALGLGIPALKSRLCRARLMLREALAPHFAISAKRMGL